MSSDASDPTSDIPFPPSGHRPPYSSRPPAPRGSGLLGCLFALSMLVNVVGFILLAFMFLAVVGSHAGGDIGDSSSVTEKLHSGKKSAKEKIAIVHLDGVIAEGLLDFVHKEIEHAASDDHVKAVVLRINSPGGSITASDDLYQRLMELRDGTNDKSTSPKPLVVSMGALAASGGYYVAMPAKSVFAERTTLTGSIGVYASFLNIKGLSKQYGFDMTTIKQGKIKDSGSPFKDMSAEERQVWQDLVDHAYDQFVGVVETGRPNLKGKLLAPITMQPVNAGPPQENKAAPYKRYRADGGIFTADKALEFGLVDQIGTLDDAIKELAKLAGLEDYKAVDYEKPKGLLALLGAQSAKAPATLLDAGLLQGVLTPRLWYLAPGCELNGLLAGSRAEQ